MSILVAEFVIWVISTNVSFSFPHHESRVGDQYNAVVPKFDENLSQEVRNSPNEDQEYGKEDKLMLLWETSFLPAAEDSVNYQKFLDKARADTLRNDDFLLNAFYSNKFDSSKTFRYLKKVAAAETGDL